MKERVIPNWLYSVLFIIFLTSLILYFKFSEAPNWSDLFINVAGTIIGILITIGFIDLISNRYNKKMWLNVDVRIRVWLVDILIIFYNYYSLNIGELQKWIKIFNNKDLQKTEKLNLLSKDLHKIKIDKKNLETIILDKHLVDFYSSGYKSVLESLDDFWRLYHLRLSHKESPLIMELQTKISEINRDFQMIINFKNSFEILEKKFDAQSINNSLEHYSTELYKLSEIVHTLSQLIIKK